MRTIRRSILTVAILAAALVRADDPRFTFKHYAGSDGGTGTEDGKGPAARFFTPVGIATDLAGNVYVADILNHTIRKVTPGGAVTLLAGSGFEGALNGVGSKAWFSYPADVAVDAAGNDTRNDAIRRITPDGTVDDDCRQHESRSRRRSGDDRPLLSSERRHRRQRRKPLGCRHGQASRRGALRGALLRDPRHDDRCVGNGLRPERHRGLGRALFSPALSTMLESLFRNCASEPTRMRRRRSMNAAGFRRAVRWARSRIVSSCEPRLTSHSRLPFVRFRTVGCESGRASGPLDA